MWLEKIINYYKKAINCYEQAIALDPTNLLYLTGKIQFYSSFLTNRNNNKDEPLSIIIKQEKQKLEALKAHDDLLRNQEIEFIYSDNKLKASSYELEEISLPINSLIIGKESALTMYPDEDIFYTSV